MIKKSAAVIALLLLTPLASRAQLAAQQPLTLQQQLDLAKAAIDHSLDSMSALIIQQDAIIASLKAPATPAQPSAAPKPKPPRPTQSPHAPNEGGEP
jgi:hypothetical protein